MSKSVDVFPVSSFFSPVGRSSRPRPISCCLLRLSACCSRDRSGSPSFPGRISLSSFRARAHVRVPVSCRCSFCFSSSRRGGFDSAAFGRFSSTRQSCLARGVELKAEFGGSEESERGAEAELGVEGERRRSVESGLVEEKSRAKRRVGAEKSVVPTMVEIFDLEKQFSFYGSYHSNKVNIFIHMLFVWPIFYTSLILWAYTPPLAPLPLAAGTLPFQEYMVFNWSFFQAAFYGLYYIALDKKAGSLGALICLSCWIGANAVAQALPWSLSWKIVLASQVTCWFFQVFGHQKFEGRAPALLDNLPQALLMAPFFVLLECLQTLGYEPYPGFHKRVQKKVDDSIREFRQSKARKTA